MKTIHDLRTAHLETPTWLTIGNFDGMHLGHQALVERAAALAAASQGAAALMTFGPHPAAVLRPDIPLLRLTTQWERLRLAATHGAAIGVIQPFTQEIAQLSAREFVILLKQHLNLAGLVAGPDFALGRKRAGDLQVLRTLGEELDFKVEVVDAVVWNGNPVRSSAVRDALLAGDLLTANAMLGRDYRLSGVVSLGDQRGRTIGVPTANVAPAADAVIPDNGVYATRAILSLPNRRYEFIAATNVGTRPTVDGTHRRIEAHLLDFPPAELPDDLYGMNLTLEFAVRLRDEVRFSGLDALIAQIQADIAATRAHFGEPPRPN